MNIQNKVAIVTGGASGLGLAVTERLIKLGAKVAVFDLNQEAGSLLVDRSQGCATFAKVNVTDEESVKAAIEQTVDAFGAIDLCINCAGVGTAGKVLGRDGALDFDKFTSVININLNGTFNVLRLAAEKMATNTPDPETGERGVIINTASVAAFEGQIGQAAYSASKAAIVGMTLPIARDLANHSIRIMTVAPGLFETPMMMTLADEVRDPLIEMIQSPKRFGQPDEFASLCCHIVENAYLNGEVIRLDAAIRMQPR
ncbi:MAG: 3-hydroxyacyl-CoA dehydrogenase [Amphritea sp.]